jgi:hypothetical protein
LDIAASIDSPVLVTNTESSPILPIFSNDVELIEDAAISFFQGPGESPESSGLGNGVISPSAAMMGLGTLLLLALPVPMLLARAALRLGVLCKALREPVDSLFWRGRLRGGDNVESTCDEERGLLELTSVDIRRGVAAEWWAAARSADVGGCIWSSPRGATRDGGDGAVVVVWKGTAGRGRGGEGEEEGAEDAAGCWVPSIVIGVSWKLELALSLCVVTDALYEAVEESWRAGARLMFHRAIVLVEKVEKVREGKDRAQYWINISTAVSAKTGHV